MDVHPRLCQVRGASCIRDNSSHSRSQGEASRLTISLPHATFRGRRRSVIERSVRLQRAQHPQYEQAARAVPRPMERRAWRNCLADRPVGGRLVGSPATDGSCGGCLEPVEHVARVSLGAAVGGAGGGERL
eukprot:scaffold315303_cov30-Tisochrysis_lutea.AAC.1